MELTCDLRTGNSIWEFLSTFVNNPESEITFRISFTSLSDRISTRTYGHARRVICNYFVYSI
jgi:hypothetical protein